MWLWVGGGSPYTGTTSCTGCALWLLEGLNTQMNLQNKGGGDKYDMNTDEDNAKTA